jgi:hypothetical protein
MPVKALLMPAVVQHELRGGLTESRIGGNTNKFFPFTEFVGYDAEIAVKAERSCPTLPKPQSHSARRPRARPLAWRGALPPSFAALQVRRLSAALFVSYVDVRPLDQRELSGDRPGRPDRAGARIPDRLSDSEMAPQAIEKARFGLANGDRLSPRKRDWARDWPQVARLATARPRRAQKLCPRQAAPARSSS